MTQNGKIHAFKWDFLTSCTELTLKFKYDVSNKLMVI